MLNLTALLYEHKALPAVFAMQAAFCIMLFVFVFFLGKNLKDLILSEAPKF